MSRHANLLMCHRSAPTQLLSLSYAINYCVIRENCSVVAFVAFSVEGADNYSVNIILKPYRINGAEVAESMLIHMRINECSPPQPQPLNLTAAASGAHTAVVRDRLEMKLYALFKAETIETAAGSALSCTGVSIVRATTDVVTL